MLRALSDFKSRVKNHTPNLWQGEARLNSALRVADLANNSVGGYAAVADANPVRLLGALVGGAVGVIMLYADQGVKAPEGKTLLQKWKNAILSPNESFMYFGIATSVPMAIISHLSQLYFGLFCNRPEQLWQLAVGITGDVSGYRAFYKQAVKTDALSDKASVAAQEVTGSKTSWIKSRLNGTAHHFDTFVMNRHTGFGIGLTVTALQLLEGCHVFPANSNAGFWMVLFNLIGTSLLIGNKILQEQLWAKSNNCDVIWLQAAKTLKEMAGQFRSKKNFIQNGTTLMRPVCSYPPGFTSRRPVPVVAITAGDVRQP